MSKGMREGEKEIYSFTPVFVLVVVAVGAMHIRIQLSTAMPCHVMLSLSTHAETESTSHKKYSRFSEQQGALCSRVSSPPSSMQLHHAYSPVNIHA